MPEENDNNSKAGITTPLGSLSFSGKRMAEFISIILLALFGVMAYAFWEHKTDTTDFRNAFVTVIRESTQVQKEQVVAQRVMNCLLTIEQKDRSTQLSNCERISK